MDEPVECSRRYSPAVCTEPVKQAVFGRPDMDLASTSYVERANLSMRTRMRRFTRLTNGFSKKSENHVWKVEEVLGLMDGSKLID